MTPAIGTARAAEAVHAGQEWGPFAPQPLPAHLPIAGELSYRYGPDEVAIDLGRFATERTYVTFAGTTAYGAQSHLPFHVTSSDWQESDEVLAAIITDFGSPSNAVPFAGRGVFDGVMTGAFRAPRVEGLFTGEDLRAFDTLWGKGSAQIVVENRYVNVKDGVVRVGDAEIRADGLFSLGYPREDGGEEINARIRVARRDLDSLRHAFGIDEYPVSGLLSGEFHLTGAYERPVGFGAMTINEGVAYGERFQQATSPLRFDGTGVRLDNLNIAKDTGTVTGAAFVGWDSTYSFNATGRRIPVERLAFVAFPSAPLSGLAEFTATGNGTFESPRNDFRYRVDDLFVGERRRRGQRTLVLRGELSGPSTRHRRAWRYRHGADRAHTAGGRGADVPLPRYVARSGVRLFVPRLSPFTTAVASGAIRVVGELADVNHLVIDGTVDSLEMRLLDYSVKNAAPIRIAFDRQQIRVEELQMVGVDTRLRVSGTIGLKDDRIALKAVGDANLGILQGFFRDVRGAGRAELTASIDGPLAQPHFSGNATITDGRIRHFSIPNSLDAINGTIQFDPGGIRLDDLAATMGGGHVQFGGRIDFDGYVPGNFDVTARGEDMHLRVPEGVRSVVDADLSLRGTIKAPTLGGTVTVAHSGTGGSTRPAASSTSRHGDRGTAADPFRPMPRRRCR